MTPDKTGAYGSHDSHSRDREPFRVMVCGSRTWNDYERVLVRLRLLPSRTVVMEGEAGGADQCAYDAATELGLAVEGYPPDPRLPSPQRYHTRNDQMLAKANYVLAFWDGRSRGTASVLKKARKLGLITEVHRV